ncbi:Major facilitator superfamily domain general substrate transporter [Penicillium longicatenatum]|uniref:Major facilitator superfamily domain general substrate transporter n=1 Tax=Penicillium longicatenatum TaxID=1561947 RepID=UPI0025471FC1|nr:Major facilitator superfamily domain general substrate transporter [Penicillium longicatenatum]KAJ5651035.1 Major facilitator superfamily domain general substrate transporter [Penicillium longicatenatum]
MSNVSTSTATDTDPEKQEQQDRRVRSPGGTPQRSHYEGGVNEADRHADGQTEKQDELKEWQCYDKLGYSYPWYKKWSIISVIFAVQLSMNWNASFYASSITLYSKHFGISEQAARVGQMDFLVAYAFGCEFWAPFSEEFGRWPIMQASLFLVNIWQIPCALAPNFGTIVVCRLLGGVSSAGGSVTLGIVADMWEAEDQQWAVAYVVLSSVVGSIIAPIVGGFVATFLSWRWNFWLQLILGGFVQLLHWLVPETRCSILVTREAKKRRAKGEMVYSGDELKKSRLSFRYILMIWARPFIMFLREPIVLCLSLFSGFSDALIFVFLQSYTPVYKQWHFSTIDTGLAFIPILVGYFIAYFSFLPWILRHNNIRKRDPDGLQPEARLYWLLWVAPLLSIGLFGFAWTSLGPPHVHWIAPMIFSCLIAIANFSIYMATVDYMIASYGPYAASATGGNGFARDFLAGVAAMYSMPMYSNMGTTHKLEWPSTLLGFLAILFTIPIYVFYWYGPAIRAKCPFAQTLASDRKESGRRVSQCGSGDPDPVERYLSGAMDDIRSDVRSESRPSRR